MTIRVEHKKLPAFLASALVTGDFSSFDEAGTDQEWLDRVYTWIKPGNVCSAVDGSEPHFATIYIAGFPFTGEVLDYVILYDETGDGA